MRRPLFLAALILALVAASGATATDQGTRAAAATTVVISTRSLAQPSSATTDRASASEAGDDRQVDHFPHDLQDAHLLVVGEMRTFAGVDVDR